MAIQDAAAFLETAVRDTLDSLTLSAEDTAARQLAIHYARAIDATGDLWHLGPELLKTLAELGATPAARARIRNLARTEGDNAPAAVSWLDQQRQSRAARSAKRP